MLKSKREQFTISLRKQQREDIFHQKRITVPHVASNGTSIPIDQEQFCNTIPQSIVQSFMEGDFKYLNTVLQLFNSKLIIIAHHIQEYTNLSEVPDLMLYYQYLNTMFNNNEQFIKTLLRVVTFEEVFSFDNLVHERLLACKNAIAIFINLTFFNITEIIDQLMQLGLVRCILNGMLQRVHKKEKLYLNFDIWSEIISDSMLLLINLIVDQQLGDETKQQIKIDVLNSNLLKTWDWIIAKNLGCIGWNNLVPLERLLTFGWFPNDEEISTQSLIMHILNHCVTHFTNFRDTNTPQVLLCLNKVSYQYTPLARVMTKSIWEPLIKYNACHANVYGLLANLCCTEGDEVELFILDLGLLDNFDNFITGEVDSNAILKMFLLLNNILLKSHNDLADRTIHKYIPFAIQIIDQQPNKDLAYELILAMTSLARHQQLSILNMQVLVSVGVFRIVIDCLREYYDLVAQILGLVVQFDHHSAEIRGLLYRELEFHQLEQTLNMMFSKWPQCEMYIDDVQNYHSVVTRWQAELNELAEFAEFNF